MNSEYKVKIKPSFLKHFGVLYKSATALFHTIWIPDYLSDMINKGDSKALAIIEHEKTHLKRATEYGQIKWYFKYIVSSEFRLIEELEAIRSEYQYLKKHNTSPDYEKKAIWLSSWVYLRMITFEDALKKLKTL